MVCKCPNCDGALEYSPSHQKMSCPYCGSVIKTEEINNSLNLHNKEGDNGEFEAKHWMNQMRAQGETMSCKICTCTSCAGELIVNDVEASTYCPYCGQPTIVFSRISRELKPKFIIPFKVTKEQALHLVHQKLNEGKFIPDEIKNFTVDKIRGVYIPYWLFDVCISDDMLIRGTTGTKSSKKYYRAERAAQCDFNGLPRDASKNLNDKLTYRLEPYDLREVRPFEPGYLSGFYMDKYDVLQEDLLDEVKSRVRIMFENVVLDSVKTDYKSIAAGNPQIDITRTEYALLPAWFLTFHYQNETYLLVINGQTGKVVGSVPFDKTMAIKHGIYKGLLAAVISFLVIALFSVFSAGSMQILVLVLIFAFLFAAYTWYRNYKDILKLSTEIKTIKFVKERQDKE